MDYGLAAALCVLCMISLLVLGIPVVFCLGFSSMLFGVLVFGPVALYKMGLATFSLLYNYAWSPLPLFVLMGCIISATRIGEDLYRAARNWLSFLPGSLISASIIGEALVASMVGASGAAIVTVGKAAEREFERYGYDKKFAMGGLMCGGVLGPLIPPSTPMIIYGVVANVSVGHLLIAGIVPGALLALVLAAVPLLICWKRPELGPPAGRVSWKVRVYSLARVWPALAVLVTVVGSIFLGIATPTEAAGIGCVAILVLAIIFYNLKFRCLWEAMIEAAKVNAMMLVVIIGASFFSYVLTSKGVGDFIYDIVTQLRIHPLGVVSIIILIYLILGCLFDAITITMLTVPLFAPLIVKLGYDLIWFGVLYVVTTEIGLITPPMGVNLFFMRNVFNIDTQALLKGAVPYLMVLLAFLGVLLLVPQLSLWLPSMMGK
ncbi:MAG: TRAP transporter large permease [candidate division WOR-3 bacterium]